MKRPFASLGPEFEPFLYASVGDEGNGMMLSVLSMLARRNVDPWREAAELAAGPAEIATKRLASVIGGLPGIAGRQDAGRTAERLVLLLPRRAGPTSLQGATSLGALGMTKSSLVIWMITIGLIMGAQALSAGRQPPAQTAQAPASTASTAALSGGPSGSGQ